MLPAGSTLRAVAQRAGVSVATVSQTFSGNRPVSSTTRERVLTAALELGYRRDAWFIRKPVIAVICRAPEVFDESNEVSSAWAESTGHLMLVGMRRGFVMSTVADISDISTFVSRFDGFIVLVPRRRDQILRQLDRLGLPVVAGFACEGMDEFRWWTRTDAEATLRPLLGHLVEQGATRSVLLVSKTDNALNHGIADAYTRVAESLGVEHTVRGVASSDSVRSARSLAREVLTGPNRPDAAIGTNWMAVQGVLSAAADLRLAVPNDLLVASTIDGPSMLRSAPRITAASVDWTDASDTMLDLLEMRLRGCEPPPQPAVVAELTIRESSLRRKASPGTRLRMEETAATA